MRERARIPDPLRSRPFSVAQAREAGLGRRRLEGDDLVRSFRGVRSLQEASRVRQYVPLLRPGDRFSHVTAAALWGAPLPTWAEDEVHVTAGPDRIRARTAGVIGHRSADTRVTLRNGLPVSAPATAFVESARVLDLVSLVAVGDYLVLDPRELDPLDIRPYVTMAELLSAVRQRAGRGIVRAREAVALVRAGVESPMETRLRLLLTGAGLPEPICGYPLTTRSGVHIGWFDLAWPERRVIAEYDGDQHRTSTRQYDRDITRFDAAAEAGWTVVRVRARGVFDTPTHTIRRVEQALSGRTRR